VNMIANDDEKLFCFLLYFFIGFFIGFLL